MNSGILIISITLLGYFSNWLNWRYLNYSVVRWFYYLGAVIHELSHALFCLLTGAGISKISLFSKQPYVVYSKPKLPFIGRPLISLAPLTGGLTFLFLVNKYFLADYFVLPEFSGWPDVLFSPWELLLQINLSQWQSWLMILLFLNVGAMIGPSWQDLKTIWPVLIVIFFLKLPFLENLMISALILILTNILIQIILIVFVATIKFLTREAKEETA